LYEVIKEAVMEAEREVFLAKQGGRKNGYYQRGLATRHGRLQLSVPRDREGRFHTALFAPYQR